MRVVAGAATGPIPALDTFRVAILGAMRRPRHAIAVLLVLGLLGFALPALALASGGGSAGDQQYTDPFGGSGGQTTTHRTTTSASPPPTSSAPATSTPATPATTTPATSPAATSAVDPTATAASTTPVSSTSTAGTLPYTGYDGGLAALLGGGLVLSGAALRIRSRRS